MPKYTKKWWEDVKQFRQATISRQDLQQFLSNCVNEEQKVYLTLLYYTGARPSELLKLRKNNIIFEEDSIKIQIPTLKRGVGRIVYLEKKDRNELENVENYVKSLENDDEMLFKILKNGWNVRDFIYKVTENKLTPYFFRHNRFTKLAIKGVSPFILKYLKGSKTVASVETYVHVSGLEAKKIKEMID